MKSKFVILLLKRMGVFVFTFIREQFVKNKEYNKIVLVVFFMQTGGFPLASAAYTLRDIVGIALLPHYIKFTHSLNVNHHMAEKGFLNNL